MKNKKFMELRIDGKTIGWYGSIIPKTAEEIIDGCDNKGIIIIDECDDHDTITREEYKEK